MRKMKEWKQPREHKTSCSQQESRLSIKNYVVIGVGLGLDIVYCDLMRRPDAIVRYVNWIVCGANACVRTSMVLWTGTVGSSAGRAHCCGPRSACNGVPYIGLVSVCEIHVVRGTMSSVRRRIFAEYCEAFCERGQETWMSFIHIAEQ